MKKIIFLFLLFLFSFQLFADEEKKSERLRLAVMEIEDKSCKLDKKMLAEATEYFRSVLVDSNRFIIVPTKNQDMLEKIVKMKEDSYNGRYDENLRIQLGQALSAAAILRTTIAFFANKYTVTSEIINLSKEATLKGSRETFKKNPKMEESLEKALDSIAARIISSNNGIRHNTASGEDFEVCRKARADSARNPKDPAPWVAYLKTFPQGSCADEAHKMLDKTMCEHAKTENSLEVWNKYLDRHKDGMCKYDAHKAIVALKHQQKKQEAAGETLSQSGGYSGDKEDCEYAEAENTVEAWQKYLKFHPGGQCEYEAQKAILSLKHNLKKDKEEQIRYLEGRKIGGLIWSDSSAVSMRWGDANKYCEELQEGGFNDWRLPSLNEFNVRNQSNSGSSCTLFNSKAGKKIKKTGSCGDRSDDGKWYWTSTFRGANRWMFNFSSGGYHSHSSTPNYVICVRSDRSASLLLVH